MTKSTRSRLQERALLIMGPTASGKSALALALAERFEARIVNADSKQAYRDLRVLSARPTGEEEARAPHALYGHVDAGESYSVGRWLKEAQAELEKPGPVLFVGGTGLYFRALTQGLADIPAIAPDIAEELRQDLARAGAPALHETLTRLDPALSARLEPNDHVRILRALGVMLTTGRSIAAFHAQTQALLPETDWAGLALTPDRGWLYQRIDDRFEGMLEGGGLEEARALWSRGLDPGLPAMKAHGVPGLCAYFRGEMDLRAAADQAKRDTRRYAKRQGTWIAHQMQDWACVRDLDPNERLEQAISLWRGQG